MSAVDPRLVAAIAEQLRRGSGERVGWKLGIGDRERLGSTVAVGHLTTDTVLAPGSTYRAGTGTLHADAEVAVEIGPSGSIARYAAALELVDLSGPQNDPHQAVAENVFHRAVTFGIWTADEPAQVCAAVVIDGAVRRSAEAALALERLVDEARRVLEAVGEHLRPGDRVITGNIVQAPVERGERVEADVSPLGSAWLQLR
jgi:hypothetical protein